MIPKLRGSRHAVRSIVNISNTNTLKSIYYVYFITLYSSIQSIQSQIWHKTRQAQSAFPTLHKNIHLQ
jgi:hypothetical protein